MKVFKRSLVAIFCLLSLVAIGQDNNGQQAAGIMESNGKLYVVVAVVLTILIGLFIYLFSLDRKMTRLEKNKV